MINTSVQVHVDDRGDVVCQHGTAMDVHCCNCHSGFLFEIDWCVCEFDRAPGAVSDEDFAVDPIATERPQEALRAHDSSPVEPEGEPKP